jgi:formamidopyrimidine-DNA glycosylase
VETIRRGLDANLRGCEILRVTIHERRLRRPIDVARLKTLEGRIVRGVGRRAKYVLIDVGEELIWLLHLGMSGRVLLVPTETPRGGHEHVRVELDGGRALVYRDPRRFGLMRFGLAAELDELRDLGPEPIGNGFDGKALRERLRVTRRDIKAALLDQRLIAGIGNIYANEILFRAGVRPTRRCFRLRLSEIDRIACAVREVLSEAIDLRGTSFSDYLDSDGSPGSYQFELAVFDREDEPCRHCGAKIQRRSHGGRSSFFCSRCQL